MDQKFRKAYELKMPPPGKLEGYVNVNCKQYDSRVGLCNKKDKKFGVFRRGCEELKPTKTCDIAERYPRPKIYSSNHVLKSF